MQRGLHPLAVLPQTVQESRRDEHQIYQLRHQRGNRRPAHPAGGQAQLAKNQHIVQHHVRKHRADAGREGNVSVPPAPQPGRQDRGKAHRREGERDNFEVDAPFGDDGSILCVQPQNLRRRPQRDAQEHPRQAQAYHGAQRQTAPRLFFIPCAEKLGDENARHRAHRAADYIENHRIVAAQPHSRDADRPQLANHDLVHDRKRRLQHTLQCDRHSNFAQFPYKF